MATQAGFQDGAALRQFLGPLPTGTAEEVSPKQEPSISSPAGRTAGTGTRPARPTAPRGPYTATFVHPALEEDEV